MDTSLSLLERVCKRWDQQAWGRFVQLYSPLIFSWGWRCGLQPADAADLTQDVFTTLFQKLPEFTYDRHKSFRAWLRTVTLNHWRDRQRRIATRTLITLAQKSRDKGVSPEVAGTIAAHLHATALGLAKRGDAWATTLSRQLLDSHELDRLAGETPRAAALHVPAPPPPTAPPVRRQARALSISRERKKVTSL